MEQKDFSSLSQKKLKKLIKETEDMLDALKLEMKQRKWGQQHEEIEHIEEHLQDTEHNISNLRLFFNKVISELGKKKDKKKKKHKN